MIFFVSHKSIVSSKLKYFHTQLVGSCLPNFPMLASCVPSVLMRTYNFSGEEAPYLNFAKVK
jgi:hypothetical protein